MNWIKNKPIYATLGIILLIIIDIYLLGTWDFMKPWYRAIIFMAVNSLAFRAYSKK